MKIRRVTAPNFVFIITHLPRTTFRKTISPLPPNCGGLRPKVPATCTVSIWDLRKTGTAGYTAAEGRWGPRQPIGEPAGTDFPIDGRNYSSM